jgi:hypothetical protein
VPRISAEQGLSRYVILVVISAALGCGEFSFSAPRLRIESLQISLICWEDTLPVGEHRRLEIQIRDQDGRDISAFPQSINWLISSPSVASLAPSIGSYSRLLTAESVGSVTLRITATYTPDVTSDHAVEGVLDESLSVLSSSDLPAYSPRCSRT